MENITILFLFLSLSLQIFAQEDNNNVVPTEPNAICPILIGEKLPDGEMANLENEKVKISELTKGNPTVIVFYRGGWCPYCTKQLSGLNEIEEEINGLGYEVLAIVQDDVKEINETKDKEELKYDILSDPEMEFAQKMGVAYEMDEKTKKRYAGYGMRIKS